jgi:hypothetical protein
MIDLKTLRSELDQARLARIDTQAAGSEVEELIWQVAHFEPGKQRMVFMINCGEPELPAPQIRTAAPAGSL